MEGPPDESNLAELREIGLRTETVNGNKLVGEIAPELLEKLGEHPSVVEIERSVVISPKGDRN